MSLRTQGRFDEVSRRPRGFGRRGSGLDELSLGCPPLPGLSVTSLCFPQILGFFGVLDVFLVSLGQSQKNPCAF